MYSSYISTRFSQNGRIYIVKTSHMILLGAFYTISVLFVNETTLDCSLSLLQLY